MDWLANFGSSVCNFLTAHAILWLATIVHRTPTIAPYGYLLWFMRCTAVVLMIVAWLRLAAFYADPVGPRDAVSNASRSDLTHWSSQGAMLKHGPNVGTPYAAAGALYTS